MDIPENFVELKGVVLDENVNPVSGARIEVITETLGSGIRYTNTDGEFSGRIPRNQNITTNLQLTCSTTLDWITVFTDNINASESNIEKLITGSLAERYALRGKLLNCGGAPVQMGYVKLGGGVFYVNEGNFSIPLCATGSYSFRGFDISNDSILFSEPVTIEVGEQGADAGEIDVCEYFGGLILDIDGNIYETVLIGTQEWMAENLKTTRYADGSAIPNVTVNNQWPQLTTGAWCNYNNSASNDAVYGKLYNWFAVADARSVCPAGWHVPSDGEWQQLELSLGMSAAEVGQTGPRGSSANVGGKMKATALWDAPNLGATNSSGFSGLPGGNRNNGDGLFLNFGYIGYWWSATEVSSTHGWNRYLYRSGGGVGRVSNYNKQRGISVRCVRD